MGFVSSEKLQIASFNHWLQEITIIPNRVQVITIPTRNLETLPLKPRLCSWKQVIPKHKDPLPTTIPHISYLQTDNHREFTHKQLLALGHLRRFFFLGAPNIGPLTYLGQVGRNPPGSSPAKRRSNRRLLFYSDIGRIGQQKKKVWNFKRNLHSQILIKFRSQFKLNNMFHFYKNLSDSNLPRLFLAFHIHTTPPQKKKSSCAQRCCREEELRHVSTRAWYLVYSVLGGRDDFSPPNEGKDYTCGI